MSDKYAWNVMGTKRSIFAELKRRGHDVFWVDKKAVKKADILCRNYKADQVWLAHSNLLLLPGIKKNIPVPVIGFGFSDPYYFKPARFQSYDVYVTNNRKIYEQYKDKIKMFYNPTACDMRFHKRKDTTKTIDISLIGCGRHPRFPNRIERIEIVKRLRKDLPKAVIRTYGIRWDKHPDNRPTIIDDTFLNVIQHTKIGLDIQEVFSPLAHRMFEYIACGTPVITRRRSEVFEHLEEHKEILAYDDYDELLAKLKCMLTFPKELDFLAEHGHQRVMKEHDIKNRVDGLEKFLGLE